MKRSCSTTNILVNRLASNPHAVFRFLSDASDDDPACTARARQLAGLLKEYGLLFEVLYGHHGKPGRLDGARFHDGIQRRVGSLLGVELDGRVVGYEQSPEELALRWRAVRGVLDLDPEDLTGLEFTAGTTSQIGGLSQ